MKSSIPFTSSPIASMPPALISSGPEVGGAAWRRRPRARRPRPRRAFSGRKRNGSQPSATSAVISTFLSPRAATQRGTAGALGLVEQLERLAEAESLVRWQREREDAVADQGLATQPHAQDLDDLAGAAERLVVRQTVEALDHLGAGRAEPEDRAAAGDVVEAGRGLEERSGGARVDVEDAGADLDRLGLRGEVAHQGGGVEPVGLGDPDQVETRLLQARDLVGGLTRVAGVDERHRQLHRRILRGIGRRRRRHHCDNSTVNVAGAIALDGGTTRWREGVATRPW